MRREFRLSEANRMIPLLRVISLDVISGVVRQFEIALFQHLCPCSDGNLCSSCIALGIEFQQLKQATTDCEVELTSLGIHKLCYETGRLELLSASGGVIYWYPSDDRFRSKPYRPGPETGTF